MHERNIDGFFRALIARARAAGAGRRSTTMLALTHRAHRRAAAVPAARGALLRPHGAEHPAGGGRSRSSSGWPSACTRAGAGLERHFPQLRAGRRRRAAAPQLRADHRPVADVARRGDDCGAPMRRGRRARPPVFALRLSRRARPRAARAVGGHGRTPAATCRDARMSAMTPRSLRVAVLLAALARSPAARKHEPPPEPVRPVQLAQVDAGRRRDARCSPAR